MTTDKMLPTNYQQYIHLAKYARWQEDVKRRETWPETVSRYIDFFQKQDGTPKLKDPIWNELRTAILGLEIMPSMRCLMTAGPALARDHVAGYNCSYVAVDTPRVFDEIMYVLMCGTGVGFSVERQYISKLPEVSEEFHESDTTIVVSDSKIGWASSFRELVSMLYAGKIPKWDLSRLRPAGAKLKTFGGRSSGPAPLDGLFRFACEIFKGAAGRRLSSLECHDLVCKIADIIVVGGVRRSALISLSNLTDERMRAAKTGQWWEANPQRALANNSVSYTEKPDIGIFMKEWESLYASKSGERGIFNRVASKKTVGRIGRRDAEHEFGTNPCSEIILRSKQFCNLSEVVVRSDDTFETLKRKVRLATILGTLQSTLTDFRYLSAQWKRNTEEERLLGVSLTGIMDHKVLAAQDYDTYLLLHKWLVGLKQVAIETNKEWAERLGIPQSTSITCVKPSGTVSQLVDSASGIHPRFSEFYIRTVRADNKDPLTSFLKEAGVPSEVDVTNSGATVFSFPIKAPDGAVVKEQLNAIQQLELWKVYAEHWCEHKPSITVYVKPHEWLDVAAWVYKHFDIISGVSFLPESDHVYKQAPYQNISKEQYEELQAAMPKQIEWDRLASYESEDNTVASQELACTAGSCEI